MLAACAGEAPQLPMLVHWVHNPVDAGILRTACTVNLHAFLVHAQPSWDKVCVLGASPQLDIQQSIGYEQSRRRIQQESETSYRHKIICRLVPFSRNQR